MKAVCLFVVWGLAVRPAAATETVQAGAGANAALRYWMAFALMENPTANSDVAKKLAAAADGQSAWDPSLSPILDGNTEALLTMRRGTHLLQCDWGYDYDRLADTPIANLPRARALARLNLLDGRRAAIEGRMGDAVDAWLAGVRFSRDIAADGPLVAALIAASGLKAHLVALTSVVRDGRVAAAGRARIEVEIAALPEAGFDWTVAARHESNGTSALLRTMESAHDPLALIATYFPPDAKDPAARRAEVARMVGLESATSIDTEAVRAAVRRARLLNDELRPLLVEAFGARSESAAGLLQRLDARASQDALLSHAWSFAGSANQKKADVGTARDELIAALRRAQ